MEQGGSLWEVTQEEKWIKRLAKLTGIRGTGEGTGVGELLLIPFLFEIGTRWSNYFITPTDGSRRKSTGFLGLKRVHCCFSKPQI